MFKRVTKRQRKREKEDELGLDEAMKQVLGLQDTDSDESMGSSSDSELGNDSDIESIVGEESDAEGASLNDKRKRPRRDTGYSSESEDLGSETFGDGQQSDVDQDNSQDDDGDDRPPMGVMAAAANPIYDLPGGPETSDHRTCAICPGKLIKNEKMARIHLESTAHLRRLQRYNAEVTRLKSSAPGLTTDNPHDILQSISGTINPVAPTQGGDSKRSLRRIEQKKRRKERREMFKEKKRQKMKKAAEESGQDKVDQPESGSGLTETRKKKRKKSMDDVDVTHSNVHPTLLPESKNRSDTETILPGARTDPDTDATVRPRPKKRRKQEPGINILSPPVLHATDTSMTELDSKSTDGRSRGKQRVAAPPLKRHDTSLYFADDEKPQSTIMTSSTQDKKTGKNGIVGATRQRKSKEIVFGRKKDLDHQEESLDYRRGAAMQGAKKLKTKMKT